MLTQAPNPRRGGRAWLIPCWLGILAAGVSGCAGAGSLTMLSLHESEIDPPDPDVVEFPLDEGYWWLDEKGRLNLAVAHDRQHPLLRELGRRRLVMWFRLEDPPAGRARNYHLKAGQVRGRLQLGLSDRRLMGLKGVVSAYRDGLDRYRGSFRVWTIASPELNFFPLMARSPGKELCVGRFNAVNEAIAGDALKEICTGASRESPHSSPKTIAENRDDASSTPVAIP